MRSGMKGGKSGFVSVLGWTNVGKSTLLNRILGQKLAITSPRSQTTRFATSLVLSEARGQAVFIDTPGFHQPRHLLEQRMRREATSSLRNSDLVLRVVSPDVVGEETQVTEVLRHFGGPRVLAVNKIDLLNKGRLLAYLADFNDQELYNEIIPVSAATGENVDRLLEVIFALLPEGPPLFPEDDLSDRNQRFFMAEIIREKVMMLTWQEVPHAAAVVLEDASWMEERGLWHIQATIHVEKDSQKSIVIGAGGKMLKEIGRKARLELETFLQGRVYLQLWVKVRRNWTKDPRFLEEIGYDRPG